MFRRSAQETQGDLLSGFEVQMLSQSQDVLNNPQHWHNVFFEEVVSALDESVFSVLFATKGRPNASVRQLVGMMILKEGFGWSDAQLFEACSFNVLVMRSLGLLSFQDSVPSESTYYLFRQHLYQHQVEQGVDLMQEAFERVTRHQALRHGVSGDSIRMDSKLFHSHLARCHRLQIVIGVLQKFWQELTEEERHQIAETDQARLEELCSKTVQQWVYQGSDESKSEQLLALGHLLTRLIDSGFDGDSAQGRLLSRVLHDQFEVSQDSIQLKKAQEVAADALQSPHDEEATFRKKRDQSVCGYSMNVTETCNEEGVNLIVDVQVEAASTPDTEFFQEAIEGAERVVGEAKASWQDGAYQSPENQDFAENKGMDSAMNLAAVLIKNLNGIGRNS